MFSIPQRYLAFWSETGLSYRQNGSQFLYKVMTGARMYSIYSTQPVLVSRGLVRGTAEYRRMVKHYRENSRFRSLKIDLNSN